MAWTVDHIEDVESDMSAFHRVDDIYTMPAPTFFSRVVRLGAYMGVVQARIAKEQEEDGGTYTAPQSSATAPNTRPERPAVVSNEVAFAQLDDWVEYKKEEV